MTREANNEGSADIVRQFTMMYDRGDGVIRKLVDAWYVARDLDELEMIEDQMQQYKKELDTRDQ